MIAEAHREHRGPRSNTKVERDRTVLELVNLSPFESRSVIVQGGAFGEHQFGRVTFEQRIDKDPIQPDFFTRTPPKLESRAVTVDRKFFQVDLPPATGMTLDVQTRRFANRPSYAFPWHGERIPVR